jgi:hypothetical protein
MMISLDVEQNVETDKLNGAFYLLWARKKNEFPIFIPVKILASRKLNTNLKNNFGKMTVNTLYSFYLLEVLQRSCTPS